MIESITVTGIPPFEGTEPATIALRKVNYFFGTNGVGKTTISRLIANPDQYPSCTVRWNGGQRLQTFVLNRDFVDNNFGQLSGIFTLGEEQKGVQDKIAAAVDARSVEVTKQTQWRTTLDGPDGNGGKRAELAQMETESEDNFWTVLQKYEVDFKDAFKGCRNDKKKFKRRLLDERVSNGAALRLMSELAGRAKTVFGDAPVKASRIGFVDMSALQAHGAAPILAKPVIGKGGVDIAAMIKRLGNSDWVRQGLGYYHDNGGTCPFCQQQTSKAFAASLEAYFDDAYNTDKQAIDKLVQDYDADAGMVLQSLSDLTEPPSDFFDVDQVKAQTSLLEEIVRTNKLQLRNKQNAPSQAVTLESITEVADAIATLITQANAAIDAHNATVDNLDAEREALKAEVWRLVLDELDPQLTSYEKRKSALERDIASLTQQIADTDAVVAAKNEEIRSLSRQTAGVHPTADAINGYLEKFGFDSFKLVVAADGRSYQLVRSNREPVGKTLSEGEKTFVVFLYFYHLLRGSLSTNGITDDRVVVFDDPVSSLDSDILFIVSSLIREVCGAAARDDEHIKQVLVLTHNVYFHHEVAFERHTGIKKDQRLYALVRKKRGLSSVAACAEDPVKTSYEMLWVEVRERGANDSRLPNTLRRILEYYFKTLGGIDPVDKLLDQFKGQDRLICRSLLSWVNAGSHQVLDDQYVTPSDVAIEAFLRVFEKIFEVSHHAGHYHMMMRDAPADVGEVSQAAAVAQQLAAGAP